MSAANLFGDLPDDPAPLNPDDLAMLRSLPVYPYTHAIECDIAAEARCRRLEKRGLVKVERYKDDPIAIRPTMYAGRLP
jgi:hypothetical protein